MFFDFAIYTELDTELMKGYQAILTLHLPVTRSAQFAKFDFFRVCVYRLNDWRIMYTHYEWWNGLEREWVCKKINYI